MLLLSFNFLPCLKALIWSLVLYVLSYSCKRPRSLWGLSSMASHTENKPTKLCFVTVGATAAFTSLLLSVLDQNFLQALHQSGYTHLLVQYGEDGSTMFENFLVKYPPGEPGRHGLEIDGFGFNQAGLGQEMRLAQASPSEGRSDGMIISHAGNTSLLSFSGRADRD